MELPECKETTSTHLQDAVIQKCLQKPHAPLNPHAQRLLTAEAREAAKIPKGKAKAESKGTSKKDKTDKKHQEESGVSRTVAINYL